MYHHYQNVLKHYIPETAVPLAAEWIVRFNFDLRITKERDTKLGDYMPPQNGSRHKISVNNSLNPYAFLITYVHEVAHLTTYNKHKWFVKPHGEEWKAEFRTLMAPYFHLGVFPEDVHKALLRYLIDPAAASCTDTHLQRVLKRYDIGTSKNQHLVHVETLPFNALFIYKNRLFRKGKQLRKRFNCLEIKSGAFYLFNPLTEVKIVEKENL